MPSKLHLLRSLVISVFLYAAESWDFERWDRETHRCFWAQLLPKTSHHPLHVPYTSHTININTVGFLRGLQFPPTYITNRSILFIELIMS
jgi:hypothetical protein